jgi:NAD(P)-dependent dehydrogenase (short-subunit alcohol dehydrogenase family)
MRIFDGQVALVTGAGAGMGREHALQLARQGAAVLVNDVGESAEGVVEEIRAGGGRAALSRHDVSDPEHARQIVDTALTELGGLHLVVSNAAIVRSVPFADMDFAAFDEVMKVNAYGTFNVVNAAWGHLVEQGFGRLVLVTSAAAWIPMAQIAHYAASKGAVLGMAKSLSAEGADHGITVNVLAPAAYTQMFGEMPDEASRKRAETMMPASLVSPVVSWLLRRENTLNGQIIEAAGGRAALNFVGSTRGYWNKDLTVQDLVDNAAVVTDPEGFKVLENAVENIVWATTETTGWAI